MTYAEEREYTPSERAIIITEYIVLHGGIDVDTAMDITGATERTIHRTLVRIEHVLASMRRRRELRYGIHDS